MRPAHIIFTDRRHLKYAPKGLIGHHKFPNDKLPSATAIYLHRYILHGMPSNPCWRSIARCVIEQGKRTPLYNFQKYQKICFLIKIHAGLSR